MTTANCDVDLKGPSHNHPSRRRNLKGPLSEGTEGTWNSRRCRAIWRVPLAVDTGTLQIIALVDTETERAVEAVLAAKPST